MLFIFIYIYILFLFSRLFSNNNKKKFYLQTINLYIFYKNKNCFITGTNNTFIYKKNIFY